MDIMMTIAKRSMDVLLGRAAFISGCIWLALLAVIHLWPASYWLEVHSVRVADTEVNSPIRLYVEREIKRDFSGTWGVSVRVLDASGTYVMCAASAVSEYRKGTDLPNFIDLGWWTNGQCKTLPAGSYVVYTTWQVHGNGILPAKTINAASNVFKVS